MRAKSSFYRSAHTSQMRCRRAFAMASILSRPGKTHHVEPKQSDAVLSHQPRGQEEELSKSGLRGKSSGIEDQLVRIGGCGTMRAARAGQVKDRVLAPCRQWSKCLP